MLLVTYAPSSPVLIITGSVITKVLVVVSSLILITDAIGNAGFQVFIGYRAAIRVWKSAKSLDSATTV